MACCGADLMPLRCVSTPTHGVITLASSAPVTTATTPGAFFAVGRVDVFDARVRVRRAHERDVRHARQHHVADILAAPLRQPRQIGPRHRAADIGIRPVERVTGRTAGRRRFSWPGHSEGSRAKARAPG